jgi:hypothetical protein
MIHADIIFQLKLVMIYESHRVLEKKKNIYLETLLMHGCKYVIHPTFQKKMVWMVQRFYIDLLQRSQDSQRY